MRVGYSLMLFRLVYVYSVFYDGDGDDDDYYDNGDEDACVLSVFVFASYDIATDCAYVSLLVCCL